MSAIWYLAFRNNESGHRSRPRGGDILPDLHFLMRSWIFNQIRPPLLPICCLAQHFSMNREHYCHCMGSLVLLRHPYGLSALRSSSLLDHCFWLLQGKTNIAVKGVPHSDIYSYLRTMYLAASAFPSDAGNKSKPLCDLQIAGPGAKEG